VTKERYRKNIAAGLCGRCGQTAIIGETSCQRCKDKNKAVKEERVKAGLCTACSNLAKPGKIHCQVHLDMKNKNARIRQTKLIKQGLCRRCYAPVSDRNKVYCNSCAESSRLRHKEWHFNLKLQIIKGYGGRCSCPGCEITTPEFLTLDHINNDGSKLRKLFGNKKIGASLYQRLIKERFPKDTYQLLCFNCNSAKSFFGRCPHMAQVNFSIAEEGESKCQLAAIA
jgi:hypothetical protein